MRGAWAGSGLFFTYDELSNQLYFTTDLYELLFSLTVALNSIIHPYSKQKGPFAGTFLFALVNYTIKIYLNYISACATIHLR